MEGTASLRHAEYRIQTRDVKKIFTIRKKQPGVNWLASSGVILRSFRIRELEKTATATATATATGTSRNKRFNEQNNSCARVLSIFVHFVAVLCQTTT